MVLFLFFDNWFKLPDVGLVTIGITSAVGRINCPVMASSVATDNCTCYVYTMQIIFTLLPQSAVGSFVWYIYKRKKRQKKQTVARQSFSAWNWCQQTDCVTVLFMEENTALWELSPEHARCLVTCLALP